MAYSSGDFCVSITAATGMPKLETGPQKSVEKGRLVSSGTEKLCVQRLGERFAWSRDSGSRQRRRWRGPALGMRLNQALRFPRPAMAVGHSALQASQPQYQVISGVRRNGLTGKVRGLEGRTC